MSEKDEVLRQISEIKNHLIDKETFFPYNYNACHAWSVIAVFMTLVMIPAYEYSITLGTGIMSTLVAIGFIIEGVLTKKVNKSYDIDDCTNRQEFIMKNFLMITLFLIVISTILAMSKLYVLIYLSWLFLISLGYFAVGFVLNIKAFSQMAKFNMLSALVLLMLGAYFGLLVNKDSSFIIFIQAVMIFSLAILPSIIASQQQKEACGV
ncbi:hypothetical protein MNB_SM-6-163 [hydrothermal vent metagenome]|uniref:Uncharacterized protein n=1 Tax=hydrothermal vent metagenome TaxID=652676 RepID=A0A1W1CVI4_9ZZZZ